MDEDIIFTTHLGANVVDFRAIKYNSYPHLDPTSQVDFLVIGLYGEHLEQFFDGTQM